jgi:hypothetical protein
MTRAQVSFVAAVVGLFCSLVLYGCGGGDDDNSDFPDVRGVYRGDIHPDKQRLQQSGEQWHLYRC